MPDLNASITERDFHWMAKAIKLAKQGQYTTSPNPNVGCVIIDDQQNLIGQGAHIQAGTPHAEIHALNEAGAKAHGATAYVTLEPCCHFGRTPPCADALIAAKVSRVVVAMQDPNPKVSGNGIAKLRQAGIEVVSPVMSTEAAALNRGFITRMVLQRPFVTVKLAISLDGKIALFNGASQWITGAAARSDVHRHRALSCAVLTGSGTVLSDNPSLLVRPAEANIEDYPNSQWRQPLRVVVDSQGVTPLDAQLLTDGQATLVATTLAGSKRLCEANTLVFESSGEFLSLTELLCELGKREINNVWVEAGPKLAGALLEADLIDELIVYQAPLLLGDKGISMIKCAELTDLTQAFALQLHDVRQLDHDLKMTFSRR